MEFRPLGNETQTKSVVGQEIANLQIPDFFKT